MQTPGTPKGAVPAMGTNTDPTLIPTKKPAVKSKPKSKSMKKGGKK